MGCFLGLLGSLGRLFGPLRATLGPKRYQNGSQNLTFGGLFGVPGGVWDHVCKKGPYFHLPGPKSKHFGAKRAPNGAKRVPKGSQRVIKIRRPSAFQSPYLGGRFTFPPYPPSALGPPPPKYGPNSSIRTLLLYWCLIWAQIEKSCDAEYRAVSHQFFCVGPS